MRSLSIVVYAPLFDEDLGFPYDDENLAVQKLGLRQHAYQI